MINRLFKGNSLVEIVNDYIVIDLETTGGSSVDHEIIEFCGLKISNGKIIDKFSTLIKPTNPISYFIEELTGISNEMVENLPI